MRIGYCLHIFPAQYSTNLTRQHGLFWKREGSYGHYGWGRQKDENVAFVVWIVFWVKSYIDVNLLLSAMINGNIVNEFELYTKHNGINIKCKPLWLILKLVTTLLLVFSYNNLIYNNLISFTPKCLFCITPSINTRQLLYTSKISQLAKYLT